MPQLTVFAIITCGDFKYTFGGHEIGITKHIKFAIRSNNHPKSTVL